ncbi:hypothetical protein LLG46_07140 [bacterium]|nr:hypothetical protein [bacterium]
MVNIIMPLVLLVAFFGVLALYLAKLLDLIKMSGCVLLVTVPIAMLLYIGLILGPLNELKWYAPYISVSGLHRHDVVTQLGEPDKVMPAGTSFCPVYKQEEVWLYNDGPRIASRTFCIFISKKGNVSAVFSARYFNDNDQHINSR